MSESAINKNHTKEEDIMKDLREFNSSKNVSTPTELLVEFLSSIMEKDYEMALKYCMDILTHEPNNTTALEFYPLIVEKLDMIKNEELDSTSSETSLSSSPMSSTSSENMFFHSELLNRSPNEWRENYSDHTKVMSADEISDSILSNPIVSKRECTNQYTKSIDSSIPLVPKPKSNMASPTKKELNTNLSGKVTPLPSNLLIHPTQTITLIGKNASNVPIRIPPRPKKETQTSTSVEKKHSKLLLLHTTPTVTFPKRLPPRNSARTENSQ